MRSEEITLEVNESTYTGRLDAPEGGSDRGVVVRPGANHGPYGDIFDQFARAAADGGFGCLRFESWNDEHPIGEKSIRELHDELDAAVDFLYDAGCTDVSLVGKSFGGGMALTYVPDAIDRMVLWAPAAKLGEESNVFEEVDTALEDRDLPVIDETLLGEIDAATLLLVGSADETVSLGEARTIVDALPEAELSVLDGADHSFTGAVQDRVVSETVAFLRE